MTSGWPTITRAMTMVSSDDRIDDGHSGDNDRLVAIAERLSQHREGRACR
jgi:hypothetical protein